MKTTLKFAMGALVTCGLSVSLQATQIEYTLTWGAGTGTYHYTVLNDTLAVPLTDFLIYFADVSGPVPPQFTNLTPAASPAGWDVTATPPSAPDLSGYAEGLANGGGIPVGGSVGGFGVSFDYSGPGTPGSQYFEVYDANFNLIDYGQTVPAPVGVPESSRSITYALLAMLCLPGIRLYGSLKQAEAQG